MVVSAALGQAEKFLLLFFKKGTLASATARVVLRAPKEKAI
jgi:hypothetical protein